MTHFFRLGHKCACIYFSSYNSYTPKLCLLSSLLLCPQSSMDLKGNSSALAFQRRCGTGRLNQYIRSTAAIAVGDLSCLSTVAAMPLLVQTHPCVLARVWTSRPLCRSLVQVLRMSATCCYRASFPAKFHSPVLSPVLSHTSPSLPFW